MEEILLSVSSPLEVDLEIFQLWIEGYTTEQVASTRLNDMRKQPSVLSSPGAPPSQSFMGMNFRYNYYLQNGYDFNELVLSEVLDQYRNFAALEHFLSQPLLLFKQNLYLFPTTNLIYHIIESYYALSSQFVRELLNKRLVKLNRKDLEDVSDSLQMNLKTITRQLNNVQQIYNTYDDVNFTGNLYHFIVKNYCLSRPLAQRYACIIFLLYAKFNITSKRRLQRLPCENLEACAALNLVFLCMDTPSFFKLVDSSEIALLDSNPSSSWSFVWKAFLIVETFELDKELLSSLRNLRSLYTGDILDVAGQTIAQRMASFSLRRMDAGRLRNIVKSLLQLGANLSQSREYRDILEDLLGKICEPLEEAGYSASDISVFLSCCYDLAQNIPERSTSVLPTPTVSVRSLSAGYTHADSTSEQQSLYTPSAKSSVGSRSEQLRKDWLRFITFTRLALQQLAGEKK